MGCSSGKKPVFSVEQAYKDKDLPVLDGKEYENEFEKECYMSINLFRADPKSMIPHIKAAKGKPIIIIIIINDTRESSV